MTAPAPWNERQWMRARVAHVLREEFLLPEYTVLAFARMDTRLTYVVSDGRARSAMLADVRSVGGMTTDDNHFVTAVGT